MPEPIYICPCALRSAGGVWFAGVLPAPDTGRSSPARLSSSGGCGEEQAVSVRIRPNNERMRISYTSGFRLEPAPKARLREAASL